MFDPTNLDYFIFALISIGALTAISIWLRHSGRSDRSLVLVWCALFALLISAWFLVDVAGNLERHRLRIQIEGLAATYASELEEMGHAKIRLNTDPNDDLYQRMIQRQIRWLKLNPTIADIYTFRRHPQGNQLIVDSETDYDRNNKYEGDRESRTAIGEVWDEQSRFLNLAYDGENAFDDTPYTDRWGTWVSAYVPMRDDNGQVEAILGVDFPARDWIEAIARARRSVFGFLAMVVTIGFASTSIIAILRSNIAQQEKAEAQLREVAQRTRRIIDTAYEAFIAIDQHGIIVDWNPQAEKTFGWTRDEAIGQSITDTIIPHRLREQHVKGIGRFLATGETTMLNRILELPALRKDGTEFPAELTITPVHIGYEYTFHAFLHDISQRKQAEAEVLRAKETAEAATLAKSEFLANMSHEIRTPMNGIIGMSELLASTNLDAQQQDYLGMVRLSANSLLKLLNDILDFSKIEAGKLELETVNFRLRDCVAQSAQTLAGHAAEKELELACRFDPELPDELVGDPGRLGQIVVNLVGNAVKFTDSGEVIVDVRGESIGDGVATIRVSVRDTGIGIAKQKLDKVFDVFSQADTSTTRRFGGTGLGLAISDQLVKLMHGRIWVESEVGKGSTFSFTADFGLQPEDAIHPLADLSELATMQALVVDDNQTNRRIFEELLTSWNMEPVLAADGDSALAEMKNAAAAGKPFPLVLLDCMMPETDGFQVAEQFNSDPALPQCEMIMVSSGARPDDAERCRDLGIFRYMLKPVVPSDLLETIRQALSPSRLGQQPISDDASEEHDFVPLDILLVDDGEVSQKVAVGLLKGHRVVVAGDGREAIAAVENHRFDVVLMDVQMPEMDGFEATSIIREREQESNQHTPIIAMTASAMKGDRERCLEAGMDDYIAKPISADALRDSIQRVIREGEAPAEPQHALGSAGATPSREPAATTPLDSGMIGHINQLESET